LKIYITYLRISLPITITITVVTIITHYTIPYSKIDVNWCHHTSCKQLMLVRLPNIRRLLSSAFEWPDEFYDIKKPQRKNDMYIIWHVHYWAHHGKTNLLKQRIWHMVNIPITWICNVQILYHGLTFIDSRFGTYISL